MKIEIRRIGNSKGIILPKTFRKLINCIDDEYLEIEIIKNKIVLKKVEEKELKRYEKVIIN